MKQRTKAMAVSVLTLVGVSVCPFAASAITGDTTISSVVGSSLSLSTSGTVNLDVTPTSSGRQTIDKDVVTASTNDVDGYTLKLSTKTSNTNLVSGGNNIAASAATQGTPLALTTGHWGYRVDGVGGFGAGPTSTTASAAIGALKFAGVPASNGTLDTLKTTSSTADNETTDVWYGVAVNDSQPTGTYTQQVTYTLTAN